MPAAAATAEDGLIIEETGQVWDAEESPGPGSMTEDFLISQEEPVSPLPSDTSVVLPEAPATHQPSLDEGAERTPVSEMKWNWDAIFVSGTAPGFVTYTIESGDSLYVIARKHRTTPDLIKKINDLDSDTIYAGRDIRLYRGNFSIMIDKSLNLLTLFADDKAIKEYRVSTGKDNSTPAGDFRIKDKLVDPTWFKSGAIYAPGSPDNELGTRWLGFDKEGYGIHGTTEPEKIGEQASEGCIRMLNEDVEELYSLVPVGTRVLVQD